MKEAIIILIWLLEISVHGEAHFEVSYSPIVFYNENACKIDAQRINEVASDHLNAQCVMTCEGRISGFDNGCGKAKQEYRLKKIRGKK